MVPSLRVAATSLHAVDAPPRDLCTARPGRTKVQAWPAGASQRARRLPSILGVSAGAGRQSRVAATAGDPISKRELTRLQGAKP